MEDEEEKQIQLTFIFRRQEIRVHSRTSCTVGEVGEQLRSITSIAPHTMRLLPPPSHRTFSSSLLPFSPHHSPLTLRAAGLTEDLVLRIMGSLPEELQEILGQQEESTIIGFIEEERRTKQRSAPINSLSRKLPQGTYVFSNFKTLELPGIKLNPPPNRALEIMHKLASDPGIVSIMKKHQWRVGLMSEMAPLGYVGISPKCVLGLNKNHGEEISLRLRTDDLNGFRKYESIKKTLLHELAHMVYSEHDADFYALDRQLNEESVALDWTKQKGHMWGGLRHYDEEDTEDAAVQVGSSNIGYKVGGSTGSFYSSAQSAAASAALQRLENASSSVKETENDDLKEVFSSGNGNQPENQSSLICGSQLQTDDEDLQIVGTSLNNGDNEALVYGDDFKVLFKKRDENVEKEANLDDFHYSSNLDIAEHEATSEGMDYLGTSMGADFQSNIVSKTMKVECESHSNVEGQGVVTTAYLNGEAMKDEPDPDDTTPDRRLSEPPSTVPNTIDEVTTSNTKAASPFTHDRGIAIGPDNLDLGVIQEPGEIIWKHLAQAITELKEEATPSEAMASLQTLLVILRNIMEHPHEAKFKRIRKANPIFQSRVAKFKGALEILHTIGFSEQSSGVLEDDFLILERNDPGLLWLARSTLETCLA